METINVLITTQQPISTFLAERLRKVSPLLEIHIEPSPLPPNMSWQNVEVLFTDTQYPPAEAAPKLRWIQLWHAGADRFLNHPIAQRVIVTTTSGIQAVSVAEHAVMMMIAFARKLPLILDNQKVAGWPANRGEIFEPYELWQATAGIIGYGNIGQQIGRLCHAFGMHVVAADRQKTFDRQDTWLLPGLDSSGVPDPEQFYDPSDISLLLKESDYVIVAAPYTRETKNLIDAKALHLMKASAVLINIGRGGVVDEAALVNALQAGTIRGAGLDVYGQEPLPPSNSLWKAPNLILSPHVAGFSRHYADRATLLFAENLRRYLAGEQLINVVDLNRGF